MEVKRLVGNNFRNLFPFSVEFCDGMNIIYGDNAQGKTNLIEALWLFTGAKSFRTSKDTDLIALGKEKAEIGLEFISGGILREASITIKNRRSAVLDNKSLKTASALAGVFRATVFSPTDLSIVKDGPSIRRRFIDLAIGQLYPNYVDILKLYTKAVMQRNMILKKMNGILSNEPMLDVFESEIAQSGKKIIEYRIKYCEKLTETASEIYSELSSFYEELKVEYIRGCSDEDFEEKLYMSRKKDIYTCSTSVGPHRDDLNFCINGISARSFGSQGQQRSVAIALKLAESRIMNKITGERPIAILDDVMSELDIGRQNFILNHIKDWQVFITCCDPSNITLLNEGKIIKVSGGKIKTENNT